MKKKVLIVDDSAFVRQTLREMLSGEKDIEVVAVAVNGVDAIEKCLRYSPDVILLDLEMPLMDGFGFMRWLMMERPTPVIVVSSYSHRDTVFRALEAGAIDFIAKPTAKASIALRTIANDLLRKVREIDRSSINKLYGTREKGQPLVSQPVTESRFSVIAIGASTGGPQAIELILKRVPPLGIPVLISQHMPKGFTRTFAERLDRMLPWEVKEAEQDEPLRGNRAYICPGGLHMRVKKINSDVFIDLKRPSKDDRYIPSVDLLMASVGEIFKNRAIGVILTGMGRDGKKGMKVLYDAGGYTIAESEETAVVFGMPKVVLEAGLAKALPLYRIPSELVEVISSKEVP